jgi:hypothetical protein
MKHTVEADSPLLKHPVHPLVPLAQQHFLPPLLRVGRVQENPGEERERERERETIKRERTMSSFLTSFFAIDF